MDRVVIDGKLESLRRCVSRIQSRLPDSVDSLTHDIDSQDILAVNLVRAVQLCVDLAGHLASSFAEAPPPATMGQAFDVLAGGQVISAELARSMKAAVGFRNVAVHAYQQLDLDILFAIVTERLGDFAAFAAAVVQFVETD